jgi:polar amino acid transport system substrate-binding protein
MAATLDKVKEADTLTLGYPIDARPFAFQDQSGHAVGYAVEICERLAEQIKNTLGLSSLTVTWVPIARGATSEAVAEGKVDMLCSAEPATAAARKQVAFSLPIFPGGIGAVLRSDAPAALQEVLTHASPSRPVWRGSPARTVLEQKTFSVMGGSAGERWLTDRLATFEITAKVNPVDSFDAGIREVMDGVSDVFFGNRASLLDVAARSPWPRDLVVLDRLFTHDSLSLVVPRGDEDFRLAVDQGLSNLVASNDFRSIYSKWFGAPDESARTFFEFSTLSE